MATEQHNEVGNETPTGPRAGSGVAREPTAQQPIQEKMSEDVDIDGCVESQTVTRGVAPKQSAFKALGWLDRFLAIWILLAMAAGILLGNFVPGTAVALEKGEFVGVSVPIGKFRRRPPSIAGVTCC